MLLVLSFWRGDSNLAKKNLRLMMHMGVGQEHEILIVTSKGLDAGDHLAIAANGFKRAHLSFIKEISTAWPYGANFHFAQAVAIVESPQFGNIPFLWYEPDAVFLRGTSLDEIEHEYKGCMSPMMGAVVKTGEHHMNGVGVWNHVSHNCPLALSAPVAHDVNEAMTTPHIAFDFGSRHQHMPLCHESELFQNEYRQEANQNGDGPERWSFIKPKTALFHTEKTGRLIEFLMASYGFVK